MRPTTFSRPSILTLRANASRTRSSLLLATRSVKNRIGYAGRFCGVGGAGAASGARARLTLAEDLFPPGDLEDVDKVEQAVEQQVVQEQHQRDREHEDDDDLRRADQVFLAGPVDLLHLP